MIASANELKYFNEVCKTLNLSRASQRLGISQPTLSNAIKRLEKNIGVELFIRSKTGVKLTKAGLQLYAHSNELINLWNSVKAESLASYNQVQGHVSLGCHPSVAMHKLPQILSTLLKQYPRLEISLKHDLSRKILEGIINLNIDIAVVVNPVRHPDLILQKLYDDEVGFWQSINNENKALPETPTFVCDINLTQTQHLLKNIEKNGINNYHLLTSTNLNVIASLTAHDCGIGILPRNVALTAQKDNLKPLINMPSYKDEIYLVYRSEQRHVKALQVIIQAIKAQFLAKHQAQ